MDYDEPRVVVYGEIVRLDPTKSVEEIVKAPAVEAAATAVQQAIIAAGGVFDWYAYLLDDAQHFWSPTQIDTVVEPEPVAVVHIEVRSVDPGGDPLPVVSAPDVQWGSLAMFSAIVEAGGGWRWRVGFARASVHVWRPNGMNVARLRVCP